MRRARFPLYSSKLRPRSSRDESIILSCLVVLILFFFLFFSFDFDRLSISFFTYQNSIPSSRSLLVSVLFSLDELGFSNLNSSCENQLWSAPQGRACPTGLTSSEGASSIKSRFFSLFPFFSLIFRLYSDCFLIRSQVSCLCSSAFFFFIFFSSTTSAKLLLMIFDTHSFVFCYF